MTTDPVLSVMKDRTQSKRTFHVTPAPFHFEELLIGESEVSGGEAVVTRAQQPLAVELRLFGDGRFVDAVASVAEASSETPERWRGL